MVDYRVNYDRVSFVIRATELSTNIADNTSTVQVIAEIKADRGSGGYNGYPQTLMVQIGSTTVASLSNITYNLSNGGAHSLGTWKITIDRDSYATTVPIYGQISDAGYLGEATGTTATISENLALSEIAQASNPSLSISNVNLGDTVRINTNRLNSGYTHTINYQIGTKIGTISSNVGASYDWITPKHLAEAFPTALSGVVEITVITYNGSKEVGSNTVRLTVNIDTTGADFIPYVQTPNLEERNQNITRNIGEVWVQNQSLININAGSVADFGADIVSGFVILNPGVSEQRIQANLNAEFDVLDLDLRISTAGTVKIALEVVDSRGLRGTSEVVSINVLAYRPPALSNVTANRDPDEPTKIFVNATGTGSHLNGQNTLTLNAYIRSVGEAAWDATNRVTSNTSENGLIGISNQSYESYSETVSFEVQIELRDELSSNQVSIVKIGTTSVLLDAYKDIGVAIGKLYEPEFGGSLQVGEGGLVSFGHMSVDDESVMYLQRDTIADGDDLNNYLESGIYSKTTGNSEKRVQNLPSIVTSDSNLVVQVINVSDAVTIQWVMQVPASVENIVNPIRVAVRSRYLTFWNPWTTIA